MRDPSGGQLGRDVHRGYIYFDSGDCNSHVARLGGGLQPISYWTR
jgi:hypothetical protein